MMSKPEVVAWRSWYQDSNNWIIWQQKPHNVSGALQSLIKLEDHEHIVKKLEAKIAAMDKEIGERALHAMKQSWIINGE